MHRKGHPLWGVVGDLPGTHWQPTAHFASHDCCASDRCIAPGPSRLAVCTGPGGHLTDLARSGYTLLTGYNYNLGWQSGGGSRPFRKLIEGNESIFKQFAEQTPLPYVPVVTVGWDRRPWEKGKPPPETMSVWYPDRTPKLVEEFVRLGIQWLDGHANKATAQ